MAFEITEAQVQRMLQDGIQSAINSMLRDSYGTGQALKKAVEKAIAESEPQIVAALKAGISQACVAPGFLKAIEHEIASSLASQYRGAFDGVVRAAAKQAANNEVIAKRIVELTQKAAGVPDGKAKEE